MSSISIIYRKDKLNKKGEAPIYFRIIKDRKISYISSGISVHFDFWDFNKNTIKSKHPNSNRIKSVIANKFSEIQDQVFDFDNKNKSVTSRKIRDYIYGNKPTDFFTFADNMTKESYKNGGKIGTYQKNCSIIEKLRNYTKGSKITFHDIDINFLNKYETHLRGKVHNNKTNTVAKDFRYLRKIFNDAIKQDIIDYNTNPFNKYTIKTEKTERVFLSDEEIDIIEDYKTTPGTRLELHKDMFIFACYTGGIRISDLLLLRWNQFDGTHLNFTTHKTATQISLKVPTKGLKILSKYEKEEKNINDYIFPMIKNDLDRDDDKMVDKAISSANAYINKNLKIIEKKLKLNKHISFHTSRHSWATRALRKGMRIEYVSKLMTHSNIKTTQIYAKVVNSELDKAMDVFG